MWDINWGWPDWWGTPGTWKFYGSLLIDTLIASIFPGAFTFIYAIWKDGHDNYGDRGYPSY